MQLLVSSSLGIEVQILGEDLVCVCGVSVLWDREVLVYSLGCVLLCVVEVSMALVDDYYSMSTTSHSRDDEYTS